MKEKKNKYKRNQLLSVVQIHICIRIGSFNVLTCFMFVIIGDFTDMFLWLPCTHISSQTQTQTQTQADLRPAALTRDKDNVRWMGLLV